MRRALLAVGLAALVLRPAPAPATGPATLAVTFFDNHTGDAAYDPLGRGLASMLITDLAVVSGLRLVERARVADLLGELELQKSPWVDPASAAEMGRGLGADYVLTGAFAAVQPAMRIDARVVSVRTGQVVHAAAVQGAAAEFFLLEKELATGILEGLEVQVSARETARLGRVATESFDAFLSYSRGLEALDRGSIEQARSALEEALKTDDRFALATDALDDLRRRMDALSARRDEVVGERIASVVARIEELAAAGGPYDSLQTELQPVTTALNYLNDASDVIAIAGRLLDLSLPEELRLGGPGGYLSLNEWAMANYALAAWALGRRAELLSYGEAFLDRYPASAWHAAITNTMEQALKQMKAEEQGKGEADRIRALARAQADRTRCLGEKDPGNAVAACRRWVEAVRAVGDPVPEGAEEGWARAAARLGDVEQIRAILESARARDRYSEAAEDVAGILQRAEKARAEAEEARRKLPDADKEGTVYGVADDLYDAGAFDEARAALDRGLSRWPASDRLHRLALDQRLQLGDRPGAEAALARWEAAEAQGATVDATRARRVRDMDAADRWVRDAEATALLQLATGLNSAAQYAEAGAAYLELADRYPRNEAMDAALALFMAGTAFRQAGRIEDARKAWERVLADYPDHTNAASARSMLATIPR